MKVSVPFRFVRVLAWILGAVAAVAVVATAAAWFALRASLPTIEGEATLAGLSAPVSIEREQEGMLTTTHYTVHDPPTARQATALTAAVRCGRKDMVELLVHGGADLEAADADGFTPLAWAVKLGREDIAAVLRQGGAREPGRLNVVQALCQRLGALR